MNETRYYYTDRNNQAIGPYTFGELRQLHIGGQILSETYVAEEGGQAWKPFGNVLLLCQQPGLVPLPPSLPATTTERKSKLIAGLLGILLGALGAHNFYLGYTNKALAQLLMSVLSVGLLAIVAHMWGLIEGVLILVGKINKDGKGQPLID